jgi:hypothetical protein
MTKLRLRVSFLVCTTALLACDGSTSSPSPGSSATAADFCNSLLQGVTELAARCYGGDAAFWNDLYRQILDCSQLAQRVSSGELSYDSGLGAECLKSITGVDCAQTSEITACSSAVVGHVPAGGSCSDYLVTLFSGCAPGTYCEVGINTCTGTCKSYAQAGASCAYSSDTGSVSCASGSSCQLNTDVCVPDVAEGQPCQGETAGDCADGLYCQGGDWSTVGTCQKRKTSGACEDSSECASSYGCLGEPGATTCRKMKAPGEPCTPGLQECIFFLTWCGSDGRCTDSGAKENQACGYVNSEYIPCDAGLYCADATGSQPGTCQQAKPSGSPCTSGIQCAGSYGYCDQTSELCVSCE